MKNLTKKRVCLLSLFFATTAMGVVAYSSVSRKHNLNISVTTKSITVKACNASSKSPCWDIDWSRVYADLALQDKVF